MKLIPNLMLAMLMAAPAAGAFNFEVTGIERVPVENNAKAFHPVFSPDGQQLFVSSENFGGLGVVNINTGKHRQISDFNAAGLNFAISPDGNSVIVRENDYFDQTVSLHHIDLTTGVTKCLARDIEHTNALRFDGESLVFADQKAEQISASWVDPSALHTKSLKNIGGEKLLTEEDLKLALYIDGVRTIVDPILDQEGRDVNYCWSSLSPNGRYMLFVAGNDAYTCALDGSELVNLGPLHAPVWRDDNTVVAMLDEDDGHFITASDIYIAERTTARRIRLTPETDEIKMFPSVSPDGNRIAFHTTDGDLYIINITEK